MEQAWLFGVSFVVSQSVTWLGRRGPDRLVGTSDGSEVAARAIVIASGVSWRRLGVLPVEELIGAGVFYGAAGAEARALHGQDVFVVGAGNSAGQAALHLAKYTASVTMLVRGEALGSTMSDYLTKEIHENPRIHVRFRTQVVDGGGRGHLETVTLRTGDVDTLEVVSASALFLLIGAEPHTEWCAGAVERDERGYILTGQDLVNTGKLPDDWPLARPPTLLETSIPGVFAVGDVRNGSVKRVASAAGRVLRLCSSSTLTSARKTGPSQSNMALGRTRGAACRYSELMAHTGSDLPRNTSRSCHSTCWIRGRAVPRRGLSDRPCRS